MYAASPPIRNLNCSLIAGAKLKTIVSRRINTDRTKVARGFVNRVLTYLEERELSTKWVMGCVSSHLRPEAKGSRKIEPARMTIPVISSHLVLFDLRDALSCARSAGKP